LPIACQRDGNGKTVYIEAEDAGGKKYGSVVTPPALSGQPIPRTVGEIQSGIEVYVQHQEWLKYKRLPQGTSEGSYTVEERPALPPGRNVPEPIEEVEPF